MSENEAFLIFDNFPEGRAKSLLEIAIASDTSLLDVRGWQNTVNWCLRTFATGTNVTRAVLALRFVHQSAGESEDKYFGRLAAFNTACGSFLLADSLKTLLINGLDGQIVESVHSFLPFDLVSIMASFLRSPGARETMYMHLFHTSAHLPDAWQHTQCAGKTRYHQRYSSMKPTIEEEHLMFTSVSIPTGTDSSMPMNDEELLKMSEVRPEGRVANGNNR